MLRLCFQSIKRWQLGLQTLEVFDSKRILSLLFNASLVLAVKCSRYVKESVNIHLHDVVIKPKFINNIEFLTYLAIQALKEPSINLKVPYLVALEDLIIGN